MEPRQLFTARFADDEVEMEFYGAVGGDFFEEGIETKKVLTELNKMQGQRLRGFVNSPGGNAFDGFQVANRIRSLRERGRISSVVMEAEGIVASAATLIFMQGDVRRMRAGAQFMIHEARARFVEGGTAQSHRTAADALEKMNEDAITLYAEHAALTREEIAEAMAEETYYDAQEAANLGFATEAVDQLAVAAYVSPETIAKLCPGYREPEKAAPIARKSHIAGELDLRRRMAAARSLTRGPSRR